MTALEDDYNHWTPARGWHGPEDPVAIMGKLRHVDAAGRSDEERAAWFRTTRAWRAAPSRVRIAFNVRWPR